MKVLRHTLVSDGTTDANLIPIIDWTLKQVGGVTLSDGVRAEFGRLPKPPTGLADKLVKAIELHPCDVLFVHRDAERQSPESRVAEVREALAAFPRNVHPPAVAVVPVRMLEAWLCFDERAIRMAAGNPNGKAALGLAPLRRVESRPDPKDDLRKALLAACELSGRRLKKFDTAAAFWRIVDCIEDFSPLRELSAFQAFEKSIKSLRANNWKPAFYG
jgi:hypothetical protein